MTTPDPLTLARREEAEAAQAMTEALHRRDMNDYARATQWHLVAIAKRMQAESAARRTA